METGLTVSEREAQDKAAQAAKDVAAKEEERQRKIAQDKQLLEDESTRPAREAAEKIRREIAEETRLRDRAQALVIEAEQRQDKERRGEFALKDKEDEAKNLQAGIIVAKEQENDKQWKRGALMRAFAASAERVFKVAKPVASTLLLLAAVVFGARLATMPLKGFFSDNGVAAAPKGSDDGKKPQQPDEPAKPIDKGAAGAKPDGDGAPDNPDPSKWGWDKYFKPDGKPIQPPQTARAATAPSR